MQERIVFEDNRLVPVLYGEHNGHLRRIEDALGISIACRGNELHLTGDTKNTEKARQILENLWDQILKGQDVDQHSVDGALRFLEHTPDLLKKKDKPLSDDQQNLTITTRKKTIKPRSPLQARYMEAMRKNRMVFGIGPAGTGKTYLAVAQAVAMMEAGEIERIILSRPAVEAGERLGFLPGEMKEKMDPYMRPLYDSLHDTMAMDKVQKLIASEAIEIAPLAFMRGRTLNNAFVILDEAQNTTSVQMLMALTRMGENSHMVITGDPSQTDLPGQEKSGLIEAQRILDGVEGIEFIYFSHKDVVRSPLVTRIIQAYGAHKDKEN